MDILDSLEVRWFLPPDAAAVVALQHWFVASQDEGERVDHYLAIARADLSFKTRLAKGKPAKVETKYLAGSLGVVELAPSMSGDLQRWSKLSLALEDPALQQQGTWLAVGKTRQLRKFAVTLTNAPAAREVSPEEYPPIGCGVELTRLAYALDRTSQVEWTFGFEAFGPAPRLLDVLRASVEAVSAQPGLPALPAAWTASYAAWLLSKDRP
jgi:hypothetical protein